MRRGRAMEGYGRRFAYKISLDPMYRAKGAQDRSNYNATGCNRRDRSIDRKWPDNFFPRFLYK